MSSNPSPNNRTTPMAGSSASSTATPALASASPAASSAPPAVASAKGKAAPRRRNNGGYKRAAEEEALILAGQFPVDEPGQPAPKKRRSLLADLILNGRPTDNVFGRPRTSKAGGTVGALGPSQKAKAPKYQPREFLLPSIEHDDDDDDGTGNGGGNGNNGNNNGNDDDESLFVTPEPSGTMPLQGSHGEAPGRPVPTSHPNTQHRRVRLPTPRAATPPGFQPDRQVASERTPSHQLYFPASLILQSKANMHAWNDKPTHNERTVFVLVHQMDDDIIEMSVYKSLHDANHDVIKIMTKYHPVAFAVPREKNADNDGGAKVKVEEEPESAESILRKLEQFTAVEGSSEPDRNSRVATRPSVGSETKYLYWGEWKYTSNCLKMEARSAGGIRIKIFVSLKQLREARGD